MLNRARSSKLSDADKVMEIPKNPHMDMPLEQFIELVRAGVDITPLIHVPKDKLNHSNNVSLQKNLDPVIEVPQEQLDELSLSKYNNNVSIRRERSE